ncbi:class I SAM-dependent methyltransferase [Gracilibacillus caseinilyticus]|uniref:Class I SAM-dependent methyltransferase n=1 Tax=Gracilibacillus caseinilyticus TaxID=2932256 RepID=A0ABY4F2M5_9BACI|nr:class I SAM-dependent methyltransferase [Gracilibacillus caseinilyticus]UOQ50427.1 class I SAM-dependent methyltransferase [Gracilibacillus caseinilyticus]
MTHGNWNSRVVQNYQQTIRNKVPGYDLIYEQMLAIIRSTQIPEDILIIGAGGGQELVTLSKDYPDVRYTAIDPSHRMMALAKSRLNKSMKHIDWYETELANVPTTTPFDIVTCHLMLHFLHEEKKELLLDIGERVKEGGLCFISSINTADSRLLSYWQQHMRNNGVPDEEIETFSSSFGKTTHPVSAEWIHQWLQEAGFIKIIPYFKSYAIDAIVATKGALP